MMSDKEFKANIKVQELKELVNEANSYNAEQLKTISSTKLAQLSGAVSTSIKKRSDQSGLGTSGDGHDKRIGIEQKILNKLNVEAKNRSDAKKEQDRLIQAQKLSKSPGLPANSTWGKKLG